MHTRVGDEPLSASTINRWIVRSQQINLRAPVRSMRRHGRTRAIVLLVGCGVLLGMTVTMIARML